MSARSIGTDEEGFFVLNGGSWIACLCTPRTTDFFADTLTYHLSTSNSSDVVCSLPAGQF